MEEAEVPATSSRLVGARRPGPFLAFLLITVLVVGGPLVRNSVLSPTGLIYLAYPWRASDPAIGPEAVSQGPLTDTVDAVIPARAAFRQHAWEGELALWDPYVAGGTPLGAVPSSGVWNPMNAVYLIAPLDWAPALAKAVELLVAMGFTYLFSRQLGLSRAAGTLAGGIYALSGFSTMWTNWPQSQVAALIPVSLWAAENMLQRRTWRALVPYSVATALLLLAGFPAVASHGLLIASSYGVVRSLSLIGGWRARMRAWLMLVVAPVAGVALAAFTLLPFATGLEQVDLAYRQQTADRHLPPEALVTTLSDKALGLSNDGGFAGAGNQVETVSFIGVGAIALAATALVLRPSRRDARSARRYFAAAALVIAVPLFFGGPVLALLQAVIPTFDMNPIGRIRAALALVVAVLAAIGLDSVRFSARVRLVWMRVLIVGVCGAGVLAYAMYKLRDRVGPTGRLPAIKHDLLVAAALGLTIILLIIAARLLRGRTRFVAPMLALIVIFTLGDSVRFARSLMPRSDRTAFYPETPAHRWLSENLGSDRFASDGLTMFPNSNSMFELRSANGHSFHATTWKQALLAADGSAFRSSPTFSQLHPTIDVVRSAALDRLGVQYFVVSPTVVPFGTVEPRAATATTPRATSSEPAVIAVTGPSRGVSIPIGSKAGTSGRLMLRAVDAEGREFWHASRDWREVPIEGSLLIPIAAESMGPADPWRVEVSTTGDAALTLAPTDRLDVVRPDDDGLSLRYADDVLIYARERALPRIRWAGRSVVTRSGEALDLITHDLEPDVVVLESGTADVGAGQAELAVIEDGPNQVAARVRADSTGFLVVADAMQSGWTARVDGRRVPLLRADHAAVGVAVSAGDHTVTVTYEPEGRRSGLAISSITAALLAGVTLLTPRLRHRAHGWCSRRHVASRESADRHEAGSAARS